MIFLRRAGGLAALSQDKNSTHDSNSLNESLEWNEVAWLSQDNNTSPNHSRVKRTVARSLTS